MKYEGITTAWSDRYLDWQLGDEHEVNPLRAWVAVHQELQESWKLNFKLLDTWDKDDELRRTRWLEAARQLQGETADELIGGDLASPVLSMFGGTYTLVEQLLRDRLIDGKLNVYFNPAGGELTGQHQDVEVLNDAAWAAVRLADAGLRVAYLDWDAHHSSQTEQLLRDRPDILTISIHDLETAATGYSSTDQGFVNIPLAAGSSSSADLVAAVEGALEDLGDLDVLILGAGADGLADDLGSELQYTVEGFAVASNRVGNFAVQRGASVLILGGGGTESLEGTPVAWSTVVTGVAGVFAFLDAAESFELTGYQGPMEPSR